MPKRDRYYFSHDYDPTGDPKMQALLGTFGGLGYGIFWRIVEMLHSEPTHKLFLKPYVMEAIAKQMKTTTNYVNKLIVYCIEVCELFVSDGESIQSNRVVRNISERETISDVRSTAGKKGAIAKQTAAIAKQMLPIAEQMEAIAQQKVAKEKKRKESTKEEILLQEQTIFTAAGGGQEIGSQKVKEIANEVWEDQIWREQISMGLLLKSGELKIWMAQFNSSVASDVIFEFDKSKYKKMIRGWIEKQKSKGFGVDLSASQKTSNSAPLKQIV